MTPFSQLEEHYFSTFDNGTELGGSFALSIEGELVLDLVGGFKDRDKSKPWQETTLAPIFSCTKAVSALAIGYCIDKGFFDLDTKVSQIWPEFSQNGKSDITIAQALSHQSGLSGFLEPIDPENWLDWEKMANAIATMTPLWEPGTKIGYHPITQGWLSGEPVRRAIGKTIGELLKSEFAEPTDADFYLGLPESEHHRVCQMQKPPALPSFGKSKAATAAFMKPWSSPSSKNVSQWRQAEIPSANGHATAAGLAKLMSIFACDGVIQGKTFVQKTTIDQLTKAQARGDDIVIGHEIGWSSGLMTNRVGHHLGQVESACGHYGWGGSCVYFDRDNRIALAYIPNKQSEFLVGDPRALELIKLAYHCIDHGK